MVKLKTEQTKLTNRAYMGVAVPLMLSTVTQPLLGAIDTAVIGMLGNAAAIAGVSLGANLFNTLYWLFGFLRISTTGHSAQIQHKGAGMERNRSFFLPLCLAGLIAAVFLCVQNPLFEMYLGMIRPDAEVQYYLTRYYQILIWGAPAVLANYVMLGWLMGQRKIKEMLFMQVSGNLLNMGLDYWLAIHLDMGITGVAAATLVSQLYSCGCGVICMLRYGKFGKVSFAGLWSKAEVFVMLQENCDLMLRTLCLLVHNNVFAAMSTGMGTDILAANSILLQLALIMAYLFEGIANASSVYAGMAVGTSKKELFNEVVKKTSFWSFVTAAFITVVFMIGGDPILHLFTRLEVLITLTRRYLVYGYAYPLIAAFGLTFYGLYTGTGLTRPVFWSTALSLALFLPVCYFGVRYFGNDGLWIGYLTFYGGRSAVLVWCRNQIWPALEQRHCREIFIERKLG